MTKVSPPAWPLFCRLLRLLRPFYRDIGKGVVVGPVIALLSVVPPYFSKLLFDRVAENYDVTLMTVLVLGIVVVSLASLLAESVLQFFSAYLNVKIESAAQLHFFNHVQHLPLHFFHARKAGEVASRFQEVKTAIGSVQAVVGVIFGKGFYLLIVPPFLFWLNWKLALVAVVAMPISAGVIYWLSSRLRATWRDVVQGHADVDAHQLEMINQIATIKVLQLEGPFYQRAAGQFTGLLGAHMRAQTLSVLYKLFERFVNIANIGLFTWLGWRLIIAGEMSVGDFVAFSAYIGYLRNPMNEALGLFLRFQQWSVHLNRIYEFLDIQPEQSPNAILQTRETSRPGLQHAISIDGLSFAYGDGLPALQDVSLKIEAGTMVGILGRSGSGKSTLLKLLTGIEDEFGGEITLDGVNSRDMPLRELRQYFSVVWQDVQLFNGTLRHNLCLEQAVSETQWQEVVSVCRLEEVFAALPEGENTRITDRGATLSGGQRQRLALARALLQQRSVILLDEALSGLDVETEAAIARDLLGFVRQRGITLVLVTHRVAIAALMDRIHLVDHGRLVASGLPAELEQAHPYYQRLRRLNEDMSQHE